MRRRRLLNKAKTLLEDESQENEENYARRYLHTNEGNTITPVHKCGSEYTQMWELRHAHNVNNVAGAGDSGNEGTPCHRARPLSGGDHALPGGAAQLPSSPATACCNTKKTQSFTTFKPREPIYMRSRAPLNMNMLFRTSGLDTVQQASADAAGVYGVRPSSADRHSAEQEQVRLLNGSPAKRPDVICSDHGGGGGSSRRGADGRVTFAGVDEQESQQQLSSTEGLCDHCAMHHSVENVLSEESEQLSQNPSAWCQ